MTIAAELQSISSKDGDGSIAKGIHREIIKFSSTTNGGAGVGLVPYQLTPAQSGALIIFDSLTGNLVRLPAPVKGMQFEFIVELACTSNEHKILTQTVASEFLLGSIISASETVAEGMDCFTANGSTHVSISMNGTTTGGEVGSRFVFTALSTTQWLIKGVNQGSGGAVTDPFDTT
jgi:hypothetical protein